MAKTKQSAAPPPPTRREREKAALRGQILDAARRLFAERGYGAVTMRDLAKAIDYAPSAIYYHFKDKQELVHALCDEDFRALAASFQQLPGEGDALDRITALGSSYARFGLGYPHHFRVMFMTPDIPSDPEDEHAIERGNPAEDAYAALRALVDQALRAKLLRPELKDPDLVAQVVWGGIHGVIALELDKGCDKWVDWVPVERRVEEMLNVLRRGIARHDERAPVQGRAKAK